MHARTRDWVGHCLGAKPGQEDASLQRSEQQGTAVALLAMELQH